MTRVLIIFFLKKQPYRKGHFRYGAWYLPKKHWRLMEPNEKLTDPKVVKDVEKEEAKKRSEEIVNIFLYNKVKLLFIFDRFYMFY